MLIQRIYDQREINEMYKSFKSFHSYLYFIDLLIITWKTMCSQICSHWLLLRSSHLVFSLIMIQTLWKKKIIYKHVQRYDNYFYQVWRFLNIRFWFFKKYKNIISHPYLSKYMPRLNSLNAPDSELFQIQIFALLSRYKTSFLSCHYD